ncbi:hypothetical protein AOLI_G00186980 [Acnodon oligacanthus]
MMRLQALFSKCTYLIHLQTRTASSGSRSVVSGMMWLQPVTGEAALFHHKWTTVISICVQDDCSTRTVPSGVNKGNSRPAQSPDGNIWQRRWGTKEWISCNSGIE